MATNSPLPISNDTPLSAFTCTSPIWYVFVKFSTVIMLLVPERSTEPTAHAIRAGQSEHLLTFLHAADNFRLCAVRRAGLNRNVLHLTILANHLHHVSTAFR